MAKLVKSPVTGKMIDTEKYATPMPEGGILAAMQAGLKQDELDAAKMPKKYNVAAGQYVLDTPEMYEDK